MLRLQFQGRVKPQGQSSNLDWPFDFMPQAPVLEALCCDCLRHSPVDHGQFSEPRCDVIGQRVRQETPAPVWLADGAGRVHPSLVTQAQQVLNSGHGCVGYRSPR